ncbi:3-oxoacyl-ACP reductase FabG [Frankia sp. AgB1.9]|jgi:3-oxoacyl-[acyl-carrier protein] reductase|uniref:3-oxoacyl-ACP reductase FabG n=1 Tax=unclassified Frankia TaxID=2632575 RepID=UPI00193209EA|nr:MULTISPECIES: 3-oxoacyl-ACP reductase FabG [unclassified Frankia]MBL7491809.1 3-oxoacyl-ACP reductase FabG [Frankia sp. AgW1.1]MBL7550703.1 3-oxoacyl-ACP reductase FabG [Frankia sp. AgB1.9]MBL7623636.1 3-oxoacyl-ACP reductase FabG [Frankia sp. AgB1.8]
MAENAGQGRVALVTGGNRGIGAACAAALAADGQRVAVASRGGQAPDGLFGVRMDVTSVESVDKAFAEVEAELGPVEIVVSNAGIEKDTLLLTMSEDSFRDVIDTNLLGAYRVAKRGARGMLRRRYGRLVFISSVVGMSGHAGQSNYAASKAGLIGFARSLARELAPRGITSNVVSPGPIRTAMIDALTDAQRELILASVPGRRMGEPEEVAAAVAFLASERAAYITGAVLPVDGGVGMGH